ncbi:MAG: hypothetical protein ABI833_21435, partial [Acidobacteriota bacterium]
IVDMPQNISQLRESPPTFKACTSSWLDPLIERFCTGSDLSTGDPYDIWKTACGFQVKQFYNRHSWAGLAPAATLTVFDTFVNNGMRIGYRRQEYAIVRALAVLCLLNRYEEGGQQNLLACAGRHLDWLIENSCGGPKNCCWGLGFAYGAGPTVVYNADTPLSTMTPYALEAMVRYAEVTGDERLPGAIDRIFTFFDRDIQVMAEDRESMATSYGPFRDRIVINALSYTMYSLALALPYVGRPPQPRTAEKIGKLYRYIQREQRPDGSWFYSPQGRSFIDCFHSCIVLKNVFKTNQLMRLPGAEDLIAAGYAYVKSAFFDEKCRLFRRFSLANKPSIVRFDLYDNAEALNLAVLLGDRDLAVTLLASIRAEFCRGRDVYSQIDQTGTRRNRNTLRWAVLPFLHAASQMV